MSGRRVLIDEVQEKIIIKIKNVSVIFSSRGIQLFFRFFDRDTPEFQTPPGLQVILKLGSTLYFNKNSSDNS